MRWLMGLLIAVSFGLSANAFHLGLDRYEVGKVQSFTGLICKSQESATHIFTAWRAQDIYAARDVFLVYNSVQECVSAEDRKAYFIEQLDNMEAFGFTGAPQNVLLFSVSPTEAMERVDYLVTWTDLMPQA